MLPIKTWSNLLLIYFILNGSLPIVTSKSRSRRAIAPRIQSDTYREHFQHVVNIRVHNVPLGPPYEQDCSGFLVKYKNKPFLITNAHCFKDLLNPRISDRYPYFDMLVIAGKVDARNFSLHSEDVSWFRLICVTPREAQIPFGEHYEWNPKAMVFVKEEWTRANWEFREIRQQQQRIQLDCETQLGLEVMSKHDIAIVEMYKGKQLDKLEKATGKMVEIPEDKAEFLKQAAFPTSIDQLKIAAFGLGNPRSTDSANGLLRGKLTWRTFEADQRREYGLNCYPGMAVKERQVLNGYYERAVNKRDVFMIQSLNNNGDMFQPGDQGAPAHLSTNTNPYSVPVGMLTGFTGRYSQPVDPEDLHCAIFMPLRHNADWIYKIVEKRYEIHKP